MGDAEWYDRERSLRTSRVIRDCGSVLLLRCFYPQWLDRRWPTVARLEFTTSSFEVFEGAA